MLYESLKFYVTIPLKNVSSLI